MLRYRLLLLLLLGALILPPVTAAAAEAIDNDVLTREDGSARQLRIFREALLQGSTEDIRLDAALGLLLNRDQASREVLISSLHLPDNPAAARAVFKALLKTRSGEMNVDSPDLFLEPMLKVLTGSNASLARDAAEAMLVFEFDALSEHFYTLALDPSLDRRARQTVIYGLQIRPEPEAINLLIRLIDKSDPAVAQTAQAALQEVFGVPAGTHAEAWQQMLKDLRQKSPDELRRERLLRQEMKLRQMQAERDRWQQLYLGALDKQYDGADEASRTALILDRLGSELEPVRLWALDKIDRYPSNGQSAMREKLLALLSDESRWIRLKTARVLNMMSALNPAEKLLQRWRVEQDTEVALAMFEALGEACFFAFSPGSNIELPEAIKLETLEIAEGYLNAGDGEIAKKGAEIVRKLLELGGLPDAQATHFLELLAARYEVSGTLALRADILGMMARLCDDGAQRERAAVLYRPYFEQAIGVPDNPPERLAAARGLSTLDKGLALGLFHEHELMRSNSATLRLLVIEAAEEAGQPRDLEWLADYLAANSHAESAAEAFRAICRRAEAQVVWQWADTLDKAGTHGSLVRELLELAEQKAAADENEQLLADIRIRLAQWFVRRDAAEQLADYIQRLDADDQVFTFPEATAARVLESLLAAQLIEQAAVLLFMCQGGGGQYVQCLAHLDAFFASETVENETKQDLLAELAQGEDGTNVRFWAGKVDIWRSQVSDQHDAEEAAEEPELEAAQEAT